MVDTPRDPDNDTPKQNGDKPKEVPSKHRKPRKRSKANKGRGSTQRTGENVTPEGHGNPEAPEHEPEEPANDDLDGRNNSEDDDDYLPSVDDLNDLEAEEFVIPAQSLKARQQQLQDEHDTINNMWTKILAAEEGYDTEWPDQKKKYPRRRLLQQFDDEAPKHVSPRCTDYDQPDRPPKGRDRTTGENRYKPEPPC